MNIQKIYQDYAITYADTSDKHYREGWINTSCPFCSGNPGNHLGYNISSNYFYCWRCGSHSIPYTLHKLLGITYSQAKSLFKQYKGKSSHKSKIKVKKLKFFMPSGIKRITDNKMAYRYMLKRGFGAKDIKKIQKRFDLYCTEAVSLFDNMDLCYRIIAPIKKDNSIVSWQSRDITGNSNLKYITCPGKRETVDHKTILYNETQKRDFAVLVEGIFDVWKLYLAGFKAVCCFGVGYTYEQLNILMKYRKILVFFDPDRGGQKAAKEIRNQLLFSGVESHVVDNPTKKDAGDLTIKEIQKLLKHWR